MKLAMVDLDGTLVDTRRVNYLAYREAMEAYGYSISFDYYSNFCNGRHYKAFLSDITTHNNEIVEAIHTQKKAIYKKYLREAEVNNLLVDVLRELKRTWKIALVTTASKQNVMDILKEFKLEDLFDLMLTQEGTKRMKPDPEGYIRAMECFGIQPQDALIFEDSEEGIQAAARAGVQCMVVKGFEK